MDIWRIIDKSPKGKTCIYQAYNKQIRGNNMGDCIVKIGNVELRESEVAKAYHENKYVVSYSGVFQLGYSSASKMYYGWRIMDIRGIAKRGRFHLMDAETINDILGKKVLVER